VYLADAGRLIGGHVGEEGLDCGDEVGIEFRDEGIIVFLLGRLLEGRPRELVNVPAVVEVDVRKLECYCPLRLGQGCDEEV
jgi:hypothetical protein